jgi:hypothetical protein
MMAQTFGWLVICLFITFIVLLFIRLQKNIILLRQQNEFFLSPHCEAQEMIRVPHYELSFM